MVVPSMIKKNGSPKYHTILVVVYFFTLPSIKLGILLLEYWKLSLQRIVLSPLGLSFRFRENCRSLSSHCAPPATEPAMVNMFTDGSMYDPAVKTMVVSWTTCPLKWKKIKDDVVQETPKLWRLYYSNVGILPLTIVNGVILVGIFY
jgi:hypothetical protein